LHDDVRGQADVSDNVVEKDGVVNMWADSLARFILIDDQHIELIVFLA
jgi:hypothetical protein